MGDAPMGAFGREELEEAFRIYWRTGAVGEDYPDYELVDAQGSRVPLPEDGVVPPEMAPPGLPVQTLDDPEHAGAPDRAR